MTTKPQANVNLCYGWKCEVPEVLFKWSLGGTLWNGNLIIVHFLLALQGVMLTPVTDFGIVVNKIIIIKK